MYSLLILSPLVLGARASRAIPVVYLISLPEVYGSGLLFRDSKSGLESRLIHLNETRKLLVTFFVTALVFSVSGFYVGFVQPKQTGPLPASLEAIMAAGVIRGATSADWPPFEYYAENGTMVGFDIELLNKVAAMMGITGYWTDMDWSLAVQSVTEYQFDVLGALQRTKEREKVMEFTIPYHIVVNVLAVLNTSSVVINVWEDVANYTIGVYSSGTSWTYVNESLIATGLMPPENVIQYPGMDEIVADLVAGRIDIGYLDEDPFAIYKETYPQLENVFSFVDPNTEGMGWAVGKGRVWLKDKLNELLTELWETGWIPALKEKYGISPGASPLE